jgi:hypothetical protein
VADRCGKRLWTDVQEYFFSATNSLESTRVFRRNFWLVLARFFACHFARESADFGAANQPWSNPFGARRAVDFLSRNPRYPHRDVETLLIAPRLR